MRSLTKIITTFFGLGYSPVIPGTVGSAGALVIYFFVKDNPVFYSAAVSILFLLGLGSCQEAERIYGKKDPKEVVIDEACGMLLSLAFLPPTIGVVIVGFLIFRLVDIVKPPPARLLESLPGGLGIMLDDVMAAVYTNLALQLLVHTMKFRW